MRNPFRRKWYVVFAEGNDPHKDYVLSNDRAFIELYQWALGMGELLKCLWTRGKHLPRRTCRVTFDQTEQPPWGYQK